jgi:hypothetical protein
MITPHQHREAFVVRSFLRAIYARLCRKSRRRVNEGLVAIHYPDGAYEFFLGDLRHSKDAAAIGYIGHFIHLDRAENLIAGGVGCQLWLMHGEIDPLGCRIDIDDEHFIVAQHDHIKDYMIITGDYRGRPYFAHWDKRRSQIVYQDIELTTGVAKLMSKIAGALLPIPEMNIRGER